ncbi:MAG: outer membrane lipoprotein carrier protein LolA [Verrucomicrobiota bacterium]
MRLAALLPLILLSQTAFSQAPIDLAPVKRWISQQKELRSIEAEFVQTRSLRALRSPLSTPGKVWLNSTGEIRWELGNPPKTIFLRKKDTTLLIHPQKQRYTPITPGTDSPLNPQSFPMMELPIAHTLSDFTKRFEITQVQVEGDECHLEFLPKDPEARKLVQTIRIAFDTNNGHPKSFEAVTKDGSSLRNEFSNVRANQKLERSLFEFDLNGYQPEPQKK